MKPKMLELFTFIVLVASGAASRVFFREVPNFAPIAAMALFAGYFFRSAWLAALVPLTAMTISDLVIGGYEWQMMLVVYGMLTLPVCLRPLARQCFRIERGQISGTIHALAGLLSCSLACSLLFFLVTNFAWWPWSDMYPKNWQGLVECYAAGIPFFKYTLLGDLSYACVLFGTYALAVNLNWLSGVEGKLASSEPSR